LMAAAAQAHYAKQRARNCGEVRLLHSEMLFEMFHEGFRAT
jgi:hypothetical protein